MKRILLSALAIGLLSSCTKEDDSSTNPNEALSGKWQNVKTETYENNVLKDTEVTSEENETCPDYTEFKSAGEFLAIERNANCEQTDEETGTYTFNGSILLISSDDDIDNFKVTKATATELVVEETTTEDGVTYKEVAYFKKMR